jgi:hypothetical protein
VLVALIGIFLLLVGLAVLAVPEALKQTLRVFLDRKWIPVAISVRIALGIICLAGAPETRLPTFVSIFGILLVLSGVLIPILGFERVRRLAGFWMKQPSSIIRIWALATMVLGGALAWAGL